MHGEQAKLSTDSNLSSGPNQVPWSCKAAMLPTALSCLPIRETTSCPAPQEGENEITPKTKTKAQTAKVGLNNWREISMIILHFHRKGCHIRKWHLNACKA